AFLLFAVVAAVTPGPSNVMLVAAGAQAGVLRGVPCLLGVTSGMAVMMFLVPLGLGSLVLGRPVVLTLLHWGGAAFLLWLSWKIATSTSRLEMTGRRDPVGYLGAAAFQWINPKSWLVTASAAGTFLSSEGGSPVAQAASLGGLFFLAALPSCLVWLAFGGAAQCLPGGERRLRIFNVAMGVLLALSFVLIVRYHRPRPPLPLSHAAALSPAARADAVHLRGGFARRHGLAVRAEVGRLSHAGVSRRRRDPAAEPRRKADEPLLPGADRAAHRGAARPVRDRRRDRHRRRGRPRFRGAALAHPSRRVAREAARCAIAGVVRGLGPAGPRRRRCA